MIEQWNTVAVETAPLGFLPKPRGKTRSRKASAVALVRRLIWVYFWLLLLEGALRKWVAPQFSGPLLVIRDPLVIAIYVLAGRAELAERNPFFGGLMKLAFGCGFLLVLQWLLLEVPVTVLLFGFRTYFLHLPLIFVIPAVFGPEELKRMSRGLLWLAIPMAILMACQFQAAPTAWINRTPGLSGGHQLLAALDRIRPPGTFSFVTGPVSFFALVSAFLLGALRTGRGTCPAVLQLGAMLAVLLALAVSGSRAILVAVGVVVMGWLMGMVAARQVRARANRTVLLVAVSLLVLAQVQLFREGAEVLSARWQMASAAEHSSGGLLGRFLDTLWSPLVLLPHIPILGSGLGVGTNVGATLLTGRPQFLLSEGEWGRMVLELGPVAGSLMIAWRVGFAFWLARQSVRCASAGNILPLLLFSACAANLVTGQISQSTILGFTVLGTGLCWAAVRADTAEDAQVRHQPAGGPRPASSQGF